ncbi:MAG TPA: histidine kinase dimerization/phospho-acceptor domain-containing protein, partial [Nitrosopumilaceae archaeon]|nr:histidine kinase dimerization/phospho-acceptor domain-containing protein [Nitrosopumilaceae archaeon]
MKIGKRLTLQFTIFVALILSLVLVAVYLLASYHAENLFYERLKERALITANIFLEKDELTKERFFAFENKFTESLPNENIQIYDSKRNIVYNKGDVNEKLSEENFSIIVNKLELFFVNQDKHYLGIHYFDNQGNFIILVSALDKYGEKKLHFLLLVSIGAYISSLLLIYFIGKGFSKRALEPIISVVSQVKKISASNLNLRVPVRSNRDEIDDLSNTFNQMLERLQSSFSIERTFVSNASHELRTPLTIIIGELQVLLSKQRSTEELVSTSKIILDQSVQLKELINSLLLLSQVEDSGEMDFSDEIRIDELLWEIKEVIGAKMKQDLVELDLRFLPNEQQQLILKGNKLLLYSAISNIIENGIKFSYNQSVTVSLD